MIITDEGCGCYAVIITDEGCGCYAVIITDEGCGCYAGIITDEGCGCYAVIITDEGCGCYAVIITDEGCGCYAVIITDEGCGCYAVIITRRVESEKKNQFLMCNFKNKKTETKFYWICSCFRNTISNIRLNESREQNGDKVSHFKNTTTLIWEVFIPMIAKSPAVNYTPGFFFFLSFIVVVVVDDSMLGPTDAYVQSMMEHICSGCGKIMRQLW